MDVAILVLMLDWRKLLLEINGALYSSEYQYSSKLAHADSFQCLFCAFLALIDLHCKISYFWNKI